jgi:hypothetical protein
VGSSGLGPPDLLYPLGVAVDLEDGPGTVGSGDAEGALVLAAGVFRIESVGGMEFGVDVFEGFFWVHVIQYSAKRPSPVEISSDSGYPQESVRLSQQEIVRKGRLMFKFLAYVDPGTGSFAVQAIIGTIMGVSYAARHRIKMIVGKFSKKGPAAEPAKTDNSDTTEKN